MTNLLLGHGDSGIYAIPKPSTDQLLAVEDHVIGVPVLTGLPVDPRLQAQAVWVSDEIAGHEVGPKWREAVARFPDHELAREELEVTRAEVVAGAIARHIVEGISLRHVPRLLA